MFPLAKGNAPLLVHLEVERILGMADIEAPQGPPQLGHSIIVYKLQAHIYVVLHSSSNLDA